PGSVRRAVAPAGHAPGTARGAGGGIGEERLVRGHAVVDDDTLAAAEAAFAAVLVVKRVLLHLEAVAALGELDRNVEGLAVCTAELAVVAVPAFRRAPAAEQGLAHDEELARVRVQSGDEGRADRALVTGGQAVRHGGGECLPHDLDRGEQALVVDRDGSG